MDYGVDKKFTEYAEAVVNGDIVAGELVRLCCQRYLSWFDRDDYYFDEAAAMRPVNFIRKLRLWEGSQFKGKPFELQDWQKFLMYGLFGWYRRDTGRRVTRHAYIQIARKCGKTSLAAAIGLYGLLADGEAGAEISVVSPSREQSRIGFKHASNFAQTINRHKVFKILRQELQVPILKGRFRIMSSDAKFGDGFNPNLAIIDEYHAFTDNDVPNLLISAQGARLNPLMLYITTAGFNLHGPCHDYRDMCADILRGLKHDDSIFPLIYEMDDGDDWQDEKVWKKCCPSLGITVDPDFMRDQLTKALNNPTEEVAIKTKTFNLWCQGETSWIPDDIIIKSSVDFSLDDLKVDGVMPTDVHAYAGLDLSADDDFTALSLCIPRPDALYFKTFLFVPSESLKTSKLKPLYQRWKRQGDIIVTDGNVQDYDFILKTIIDLNSQVPLVKIGYDRFNSTALVANGEYRGLPFHPFSQAAGNYNRPLKEFYRLAMSDKIRIDNNEAVRWCFQNVAIREDIHENKAPIKKGKASEKIDGVVAMLMAFGTMLSDNYCRYNYILEGESNLF